MHELIDVLGNRQILQPHAAEIAQRRDGGQPLADAIDESFRQQDLPAVRGAHDARRAVDGAAEVVVVAPLDLADVQPATDPQLQSVRPGSAMPRWIATAAVQRGDRLVERGVHAVAGHFHDRSAARCDRRSNERVVARERGLHALRLLLPELRAALDVGEEKGDRARHARSVRNRSGARGEPRHAAGGTRKRTGFSGQLCPA